MLATIVEFSIDAIISTDPEGIITSWNPAAERMYGYSAQEMIGRTGVILRLPGRETQDVWGQILKHKDSGNEAEYFADERIAKDGHIFSVSLSVSPIYNAAGNIIGLTEIARDITEQREQMKELVKATEDRNEFVAMVAHDIRSPATSISGFANLLIDRWDSIDDQKKVENLKVIVRKTEHLNKFIEDVLHVSRIEAGKFRLEIREYDLLELAKQALIDIDRQNSQRVHLIAPDDLPLVLGDEERQLEVLSNLLTNAIKFSPISEPITVILAASSDSVQVSVVDYGTGIPMADRPKLFQKFGRLPQPGGKKIPGTGLGLFICKNLVEAQGGKIWYEYTPDQGSIFAYTIPISRNSKQSISSLRILVVEDDPDMAMLIQSALGIDPRLERIAKVTSAVAAIALIQEVHPALVILDHQIDGDIHGLQAAPTIKSISPESRIILFTSQDIAVEASREPAIDLFLFKSEINKLVAAAQQVLGLSPLV